ncbi:kinase non-catalytic C-lobe domain-containing protein 1 isoform X8 [Manis javanica]|uniref:kinase non-catalytic C-lobe domain-containing protein 1 isoform X8 n=1 Tax=Manis javanica TaxID=9974 RepID=UPI003C6D2974
MQAMDPTSGNFYQEDGKDLDFYDFEPLPTVTEDEENVSLADILSLRDSGLSEQEAWAVCLECSLSLRSIAHAAIFLTLCITPDTLAFNTSGNVCFMEQLSDDPEGAFVPPEFDVTGNTFEDSGMSFISSSLEFCVFCIYSDSMVLVMNCISLLVPSRQKCHALYCLDLISSHLTKFFHYF